MLEANGRGDWLREDLAQLGQELLRAAQRRPVRRDWFLYDLPGLRLEDFEPDSGAASHPKVIVRLTRGGVQQLVAKPSAEGAVPALERCCPAIAQPFGLSARDGGSGGAPTWCSGL